MANLTFADLQNEVFAQTGLDSTDATNTTNVNRWINYVQQDLCARYPWPFMESRTNIVTTPDYTTGTVSISSGGTTVTGSGTTFTSIMATSNQYFIQFSSSNDWYKITAYSSATSIVIERAYAGTSNLSAATFIIRQFFYSLGNADRIIDIRNWQTPLKLVNLDPRTLDSIRPNPQSTNSSYGYIMFGFDLSGQMQLTPYPFPSDARLLEIRQLVRPTDMSSGSDLPSIPNKYAHLLAWGACAIGFAFVRKLDLAKGWGENFEKRISEMKREYRMSEDYQPVLNSIDSIQRSKWISLPDQYPLVTG